MSSRVTRIAGWAAAGVIVAGAAGAGIAYAADPTPTPTASSGSGSAAPDTPGGHAPGRNGRNGRRGRQAAGRGLLARRLMHGEMVVKGKDGAPTTVEVQRGKVTAVSASSITVKSDDGFTGTYAVSSTTRVRINEKGATSTQIDSGDAAVVTARRSGDTSTAQAVVVRH